ncbi:hypothetical protein FOB82_02130 [Corynebacterium xerosis]|uniref:GNAT family N-acetyltransferase n=1 Tax=Corynebacterium xerosis TaxID=1725 RepID=A0A6B8TAP6_9CORY|nr:hypothetical protein [Corynebacterium xerosis]QGS33917.1 hypothetical protein FOB82_02130 [Corynebacterium xerosis]
MSTDAPVFRPATDEDRPIIRRLHLLTEVWDGVRDVDDDLGQKFAADDVKYVDRWSAERDGAIIAEIGGDVAGGAWLRHFTADENNERAYRAYLGVGFEFTAGNAEAEGYRVMVHRF